MTNSRPPRSTAALKQNNKVAVYRALLRGEQHTVTALAGELSLSFPTVNQIVRELMDSGLAAAGEKQRSSGGRKAAEVHAVPDAHVALGVDLTADGLTAVAADLAGRPLAARQYPLPFFPYSQRLGEIVEEFRESCGLAPEQILGVGLSAPAIVSDDGQTLLNSYTFRLQDCPIAQFAAHIPYPCRFIRDATASGLAELHCRSGQDNLFYLSLNRSVGGVLFHGSQQYLGDRGRSGEIGHMVLVPGGRRCYCGKRGCVNAYCSCASLLRGFSGGLAHFFDMELGGDPDAAGRLDECLTYLAVTVNTIRILYDCDVVIGGQLGAYADRFLPTLKQKVLALDPAFPENSYIKPCTYRTEASAVGAALLFIDEFIETI